MNNDQLLRYSRHILLDEIDIAGQEKLLAAKVLIIGIGGLGSPAALYLAAAGVGQLTLVDHDRVELSNLQRQIIHDQDSIGQPKPESGQRRLNKINSDVLVRTHLGKLEGEALAHTIGQHDLVLDCSDNLTTRFAINRCCQQLKKPLISDAAIQWENQIAVFDGRVPDCACYRCLYSPDTEQNLTCASSGVIAPLVGIVGCVQALEAIKVIAGAGETLTNRLLLLDAKYMQWRELKLRKDPDCPDCGKTF